MPAKAKSSPLKLVDHEADAVHALYLRVANGTWWEVLRSQELEDVGLKAGDEVGLIELIRNPIYRGSIPYADTEIRFEPYRIVDDQLWYRANAALPRDDGAKAPRNRTAMQELAQMLDQAETVRALVEAHRIQCRHCRSRLRWDGTKQTAGIRIPVLRCGNNCGFRTPLLTSTDLKTLKPRLRCLDCDASFREDFNHSYNRARQKYHLKCKRCGWESWTHRSVLDEIDDGPAPSPSPSPRQSTGKQQRLTTSPARPQRAPGRRRAKSRPKREPPHKR